MRREDLFCAETVGVRLVKLTVWGRDPVHKGHANSGAEIILDEDNLEELIRDLRKAQRAKVTITPTAT